MDIFGTVRDGVVVPQGEVDLPDGVVVRLIVLDRNADSSATGRKVQLPLVPSSSPGSLKLTNERIAEILDEEDAAGCQRLDCPDV